LEDITKKAKMMLAINPVEEMNLHHLAVNLSAE
jgi:hypothetical protein